MGYFECDKLEFCCKKNKNNSRMGVILKSTALVTTVGYLWFPGEYKNGRWDHLCNEWIGHKDVIGKECTSTVMLSK